LGEDGTSIRVKPPSLRSDSATAASSCIHGRATKVEEDASTLAHVSSPHPHQSRYGWDSTPIGGHPWRLLSMKIVEVVAISLSTKLTVVPSRGAAVGLVPLLGIRSTSGRDLDLSSTPSFHLPTLATTRTPSSLYGSSSSAILPSSWRT
jgi:hypothetical protein